MNSTICLTTTLLVTHVVVGGWRNSLVFASKIQKPQQKLQIQSETGGHLSGVFAALPLEMAVDVPSHSSSTGARTRTPPPVSGWAGLCGVVKDLGNLPAI